jgi:hypothetical protein
MIVSEYVRREGKIFGKARRREDQPLFDSGEGWDTHRATMGSEVSAAVFKYVHCVGDT